MKSRERGFTFLEILIVILIIGVLTAIVGAESDEVTSADQ